jgi:hypothetical protein
MIVGCMFCYSCDAIFIGFVAGFFISLCFYGRLYNWPELPKVSLLRIAGHHSAGVLRSLKRIQIHSITLWIIASKVIICW